MKSFKQHLKEQAILNSEKQKVNLGLVKAGFGGAGRYLDMSDCLTKLQKAINPFGYWFNAQHMDEFLGDYGRRKIEYAQNGKTEMISNSVISISWQRYANGFEVVAYLS